MRVAVVYGKDDRLIHRIEKRDDDGGIDNPALTGPNEAMFKISAAFYNGFFAQDDLARMLGLTPAVADDASVATSQ